MQPQRDATRKTETRKMKAADLNLKPQALYMNVFTGSTDTGEAWAAEADGWDTSMLSVQEQAAKLVEVEHIPTVSE
jgi:hypothetical protein